VKKKGAGGEEIQVLKVIVSNIYLKIIYLIVADRTSEERRRIIEKWNKNYEKEKDEEKRKREIAEARMNVVFFEQKIQEGLKKTMENKGREAIEDDKNL
jgi:hypothetical protein